MAAVNSRDAGSVTTGEYYFGVRHTGTREALIAAGLAKAEQFPGEPGCGKTSTAFRTSAGRRLRVSRRSTYFFDVCVSWTPDERKAWEARFEDRVREEKVRAISTELMREALAEGGPRGVAERALEVGVCSVLRAFNAAERADLPYAFDSKTVEQVKEHCQALMALFRDGRLQPRLSQFAQGDADFQRFIRTAVGPTKQ